MEQTGHIENDEQNKIQNKIIEQNSDQTFNTPSVSLLQQQSQTSNAPQIQEYQQPKKQQAEIQTSKSIKEQKKEVIQSQKTVEISSSSPLITKEQLRKLTKKVQRFDKMKAEHQAAKKEYQTLSKQYENVLKQNQKIKKDHNTAIKQLLEDFNKSNEMNKLQNEMIKKKSSQDIRKIDSERLNLEQTLKKSENDKIILAQAIKLLQTDKLGLSQTVKKMQKMIQDLTVELKKKQQAGKKKQQDQKGLLNMEKQRNQLLKVQIEKLRGISSETFQLKQEVFRLHTQNKSLKEMNQQYPTIKEKYDQQQEIISGLKDQLKENQEKFMNSKAIIQKMEKKINGLIEEKNQIERIMGKLKSEKQTVEEELDTQKSNREYEQSEARLQREKLINDNKILKAELHRATETLKLTEIQLNQSKKKEKQMPKLDQVKFTSLSKEDLFNIIEQLQMKNGSLKITLNEVASTIEQKDKQIVEKEKALMALIREMTKSYPTLDQSQGAAWIQKQIIEIGLERKDDWAEIVEKVMIQNLRLKYSVTALGEQFNQMMRKDKM